MIRARVAAALIAVAALASCHRHAHPDRPPADRVDARRYDAFYLWPRVRPPSGVRPATLYLLDGEVRRNAAPVFLRLRPGSPHVPGVALWLVVRIERLDWTPAVHDAILADLARWQTAGNQIAGLQIDFDASTRGIGDYARFLKTIRALLPRRYRLSVTGLMDWSAHGDPDALAALRAVIDEVVVQTYQGRTTIPGYDAYFARMTAFPIPFRIALAEGGQWDPPAMLARQRLFRGYVVFLNRRP